MCVVFLLLLFVLFVCFLGGGRVVLVSCLFFVCFFMGEGCLFALFLCVCFACLFVLVVGGGGAHERYIIHNNKKQNGKQAVHTKDCKGQQHKFLI